MAPVVQCQDRLAFQPSPTSALALTPWASSLPSSVLPLLSHSGQETPGPWACKGSPGGRHGSLPASKVMTQSRPHTELPTPVCQIFL